MFFLRLSWQRWQQSDAPCCVEDSPRGWQWRCCKLSTYWCIRLLCSYWCQRLYVCTHWCQRLDVCTYWCQRLYVCTYWCQRPHMRLLIWSRTACPRGRYNVMGCVDKYTFVRRLGALWISRSHGFANNSTFCVVSIHHRPLSNAYLFRVVLFRSITFTVVFGLFHGLCVLPVLLSILYRTSSPSDAHMSVTLPRNEQSSDANDTSVIENPVTKPVSGQPQPSTTQVVVAECLLWG